MAMKVRGFGLMKLLKLRQPTIITIGDVILKITRVNGSEASLSIKAPPDMTITFNDDVSTHEAIEQALKSVIKGQH